MVVANLFEQVVLSPLPFPESDRLVRVWNGRPERHQSRIPLSLPDYLDYRERQTAFSAFAAHTGTSVNSTRRWSSSQVREPDRVGSSAG